MEHFNACNFSCNNVRVVSRLCAHVVHKSRIEKLFILVYETIQSVCVCACVFTIVTFNFIILYIWEDSGGPETDLIIEHEHYPEV